MALTRRQFVQAVSTALLAESRGSISRIPESPDAISEILERATTPGWFTSREINAAVLDILYKGKRFTKAYGEAGSIDRVFSIASISKPVIATTAMIFKDRGALALGDRAAKYLPEFHGDWRDEVTVQHLLTHTAGLPETLPQIHQLFARQASLEEMFSATCRVPLLFKPGTTVSYSNLGVLVVKEILERISGFPLKELVKREVFARLGMSASSLGLGGRPIASTVWIQVKQQLTNPNTVYYRDLGAPWGGVHSTAPDLMQLLRYFVDPRQTQLLQVETARDMLRDHCQGLNQPWGIGWMLANSHDCHFNVQPSWRRYGWSALISDPEQGPAFGSQCSPSTFGHYGVSGTIAWADRQNDIAMVLLTSKPVGYSRAGVLGPVSDLVSQL
jgi:CubicO group peptidase (beta-lactamase class C family)